MGGLDLNVPSIRIGRLAVCWRPVKAVGQLRAADAAQASPDADLGQLRETDLNLVGRVLSLRPGSFRLREISSTSRRRLTLCSKAELFNKQLGQAPEQRRQLDSDASTPACVTGGGFAQPAAGDRLLSVQEGLRLLEGAGHRNGEVFEATGPELPRRDFQSLLSKQIRSFLTVSRSSWISLRRWAGEERPRTSTDS